ncbi:spliceosome-associated protein CWC27 homolog [Teleopsis dalmanni]|uniref:spliceosome-associated protein CWC27 homolog n=1 Tax=Teleopsis dalmanni TaxID=139649 RepID=UPI0018CFD937|nr:spliceosome-associated protein CWC27 homolog [Teleopsis dalmanni]
MSNIYIQEPPTSGKVLLKTTVGDIDIELWSKECPKACRNFIQLCMEGYYNGTIFHRVVKDFIVQGGDPNGDGTGGESIYGEPFKDEFHTRLRYARRGLVGMANSDKDDNGSQFFFTMAPTPELQNKNTLFGKVTGDTVFNMLKLEDGLIDHNERPMYPQKIIRTEILSNPFDDIVARIVQKDVKKDKTKKREKGVKNFGLLSFGEEAEEDEEETNVFVQKNAGKAKSMHDIVDDPKLSKQVIKIEHLSDVELDGDNAVVIKEEKELQEEYMQRIKNKLSSKSTRTIKREDHPKIKIEDTDSEDDVLLTHEEEKRREANSRKAEIRQKIQDLKKEYQTEKKQKDEILTAKIEKQKTEKPVKLPQDNQYIKNFIDTKQKYKVMKSNVPKKGTSREDFTLSLFKQFQNKLVNKRHNQQEEEEQAPDVKDDVPVATEIEGNDWLGHKLTSEEAAIPVLAKDASTKNDDWYDAYDPRNPLNKRKRGADTAASSSSTKRNK